MAKDTVWMMDHIVSLYRFTDADISVTIEARFEGESLIIDGYDIGKKVEEYWGDSDYEYSTTISPEGVMQLYGLLNITQGDKQALLQELARRYNTNFCYSEIRQMLQDHKIPHEGFSWT
ncbi:MAG: hypothetical protein ACOYXT_29830 [Bacteroidota bacterium]